MKRCAKNVVFRFYQSFLDFSNCIWCIVISISLILCASLRQQNLLFSLSRLECNLILLAEFVLLILFISWNNSIHKSQVFSWTHQLIQMLPVKWHGNAASNILASYLQSRHLGGFRTSVITNLHVLQLSWLQAAGWPTHRAPQSLIKWRQFSFTGEKYAFWLAFRVVLYPNTPGVIYFLPPCKMQSTLFPCPGCVIYSLGMTSPLRHCPKSSQRSHITETPMQIKLLKRTEMCCFVLTVNGHSSKKRCLRKISPKQLGLSLHHELRVFNCVHSNATYC